MKPLTVAQKYLIERLGVLLIVIAAGMVSVALAVLLIGIIFVLVANFGEAPAEEESSDE
jgi:hypothetical protein